MPAAPTIACADVVLAERRAFVERLLGSTDVTRIAIVINSNAVAVGNFAEAARSQGQSVFVVEHQGSTNLGVITSR